MSVPRNTTQLLLRLISTNSNCNCKEIRGVNRKQLPGVGDFFGRIFMHF